MVDRRLDLGLYRVPPPPPTGGKAWSSALEPNEEGERGRNSDGRNRRGVSVRGGGREGGGEGGGGVGFGVSVDLARSCLALSVARQRDLWPALRELSSNEKLAPVVYVAGELDCLYGRSSRSPRINTPSAVEAMSSSEKRSASARGLDDGDGAGPSADPAAGVIADTSSRGVADPVDGVVTDTAAIPVAGPDTNDGDRRGNHACGRIGAAATPTTIAAATRPTAAGWRNDAACATKR